MIQKYMISIDLDKPLLKFGDNHVLVYDKSSNTYSIMEQQDYLAPVYNKMNELFNDFENLKKSVNVTLMEMAKIHNGFLEEAEAKYKEFTANNVDNYSNFTSKLSEKHDEFLATYKNTNSKMIKMIEELVLGGKENGK